MNILHLPEPGIPTTATKRGGNTYLSNVMTTLELEGVARNPRNVHLVVVPIFLELSSLGKQFHSKFRVSRHTTVDGCDLSGDGNRRRESRGKYCEEKLHGGKLANTRLAKDGSKCGGKSRCVSMVLPLLCLCLAKNRRWRLNWRYFYPIK